MLYSRLAQFATLRDISNHSRPEKNTEDEYSPVRSNLQTLTRPREVDARSFACVAHELSFQRDRRLIDGKPFNDRTFITL